MSNERKIESVLKELNIMLKNEANIIKEQIFPNPNKNIKTSTIFNAPIVFDDDPPKNSKKDATYKALRAKKGIYAFILKTDVNITKDFNKVLYGAQLKDLSKLKFLKGEVLYVGKAKSFLTRMHQHFAEPSDFNKTGSLKLGSEYRKMLIDNITIYAFSLKTDYIKFYDIIAPTVESELHLILKPLVGNARV